MTTSILASEELSKVGDDLFDKWNECFDRISYRFALRNPGLAERYSKAELQILLRFSIRGIDKQFVALLDAASWQTAREKTWAKLS